MQEGAKKRLVGAIVIVSLAVIFVPMLFEEESMTALPPLPSVVPEEPLVDERFRAESFLTPADSGVGGFAQEAWVEPGGSDVPGEEVAEPVYESPAGEPVADSEDVLPPAPPAEEAIPIAPPPMARDDGMPSYVTQVASLGTAASAQELAAKLQGEGYSAFVEPAEVGGRTYYRVRVGPEVDRARADKTAAELGRKYKGPFVQRYP
ncbi:SPOR domain-containing protein [Thiocapsa marina]|uniref:Sporulation domain-containing protein n=1 Tax=Thiocapsa marina 5811 TaxID=768671 RepID=F9UFH4_9GAMM|nr:SPOR domain-containing protein [Thiocapsa marina]EGV17211.1 Sporulation domain-containing protein [Thiocapsa marina 5811]